MSDTTNRLAFHRIEPSDIDGKLEGWASGSERMEPAGSGAT